MEHRVLKRSIGLVQTFDATRVSGWVRAPAPAKISLCLNRKPLASTWASAQLESDPGARAFRFQLRDVWTYLSPSDQLSVQFEQATIPIEGGGEHLSPQKAGGKSPKELFQLIESGHVFNQFGALQLSKLHDTAWRQSMAALYGRVRAALKDVSGYDLFAFYGTMLGAVRGGDFIGHDHDFDAAYVSRHDDGEAVRREVVEIAAGLIARGFRVKPKLSCVLISHPEIKRATLDVFHLYFNAAGALSVNFGVASDKTLSREEFAGVAPGRLGEMEVLLPQPAETFAAYVYGDDWRVPNPGFNWKQDRKAADRSAGLSEEERSAIHWNVHYADHEPAVAASAFCEALRASEMGFARVVDLGCGDGADAAAFASEVPTLGVERAEQAILRAGARGAERLRLATADVLEPDSVGPSIAGFVGEDPHGPTLFYSRFLLDALPRKRLQPALTALLASMAPQDLFAAEFRAMAEDGPADHAPPPDESLRSPVKARKMRRILRDLGFSILIYEVAASDEAEAGGHPVCRLIARKS